LRQRSRWWEDRQAADTFVFLSVACDVGICQACKPSPFSAIARVSIPKLSATPAPFSG